MRHATALLAVLTLTACGDAGPDATSTPAIEATEAGASIGRTEAPAQPVATAEAAAPDAQAAQPTPVPEGSLSATEMTLGDEDAPLTLIEYASVTCGACASFNAAIMPDIKRELVDTGLVRFVYREFPTPPEQLSIAGSMLARCAAGDRGADAYFAATDALYARQRDWAFGANPRQALLDIFGQVGMDREAIQACLGRPDVFDKIKDNIAEARSLGVNSTPTLVIDGEIYDFRPLVQGGGTEDLIADLRARAEAKG